MRQRVDRPEAVTLDLFGTLVFIDESRLPLASFGGRRCPTTLPDLDGLLAQMDLSASANEFLQTLRQVSRTIEAERAADHVEISSRERFRRALVALGGGSNSDQHAELLSLRHMARLASAVVCPSDRKDLLDRLARDYTVALVSNFDHGPTARRILDDFGLRPHFDCAVISDDAGVRKPGNEIFRRACREAGVDPADALHVGDSYEADVEGAVNAGLRAVWVDDGDAPHAPALGRIADVRDLPRWLSERFEA